MFCPNCGTVLVDDAKFCHACGRQMCDVTPPAQFSAPAQPVMPPQPAAPAQPVIPAQPVVYAPPAAPVRKSRKGLAAAIVVLLVLAAGTALFLLWDKLPFGGAADERGRDKTALEDAGAAGESAVPLEQILLAESINAAQSLGSCAGSMDYIRFMGVPDDCVAYIQDLAPFADTPSAVYYSMDCHLSGELRELLPGATSTMLQTLPIYLNNYYIGTTVLAAYSTMTAQYYVCLPEALDEPAVFLLSYDDIGHHAYVLFTPAGDAFARVSCMAIHAGVFDSVDIYDGMRLEKVSGSEVKDAMEAAKDVSLEAKRTREQVTAEWCVAIAQEELARLGGGRRAYVELMTGDEELIDWTMMLINAAAGGAADSAVYSVDIDDLEELMDADEFPALREFEDVLLPRMAAAIGNVLVSSYGSTAVAANSILQNAATAMQARQMSAVPRDFEGIYFVVFELEDGCYAVITLYDAGNNILGVSGTVLPDCDTIDETFDELDAERID